MGIGFVLMFWALIGGVVMALYLPLSRLGRRYPFADDTKRALVFFSAVADIAGAILFIVNIVRNSSPSLVFESSFGFSPTSDVKELEGGRSIFGDSGETFLRFRASRQTIQSIVAGRRLYEIDENMFMSQAPHDSASQSYWKPFDGKPTLFYESQRFDDSFGSSSAILCYDESAGVAHFYWIGVD
ncbi:MAG: hypothetical protein J2P21_22040 [Chloracidobacterium sp.]|nr:hypothetical protein [Chloracidobacterium sp.]